MNIIEKLRKSSVENLFLMQKFNECFNIWKKDIENKLEGKSGYINILNLGDELAFELQYNHYILR